MYRNFLIEIANLHHEIVANLKNLPIILHS